MSLGKKIIPENKRRVQIEEFLIKEFAKAGYSHSDIQRTPLAVRITVFAQKPGIVIGKGGRNIDVITQMLKEQFKLENPQLDVQEVKEPDLDPNIVAKQIAAAIERGLNYKRVANLTLQRVIEAGAVGVAIRIAGKVGGEMSRVEKFSSGYLMYAGEPAEELVKTAYARAQVKLGTIGIQVRILTQMPEELKAAKIVKEETVKEEIVKEEEAVKEEIVKE